MCVQVLCHEADIDVIFLGCSPLFMELESLVSRWTWSSPLPISQLASLPWGFYCLCPLSFGITGVYNVCASSMWLLGIWTQVLLLVEQALYPMNNLSSPFLAFMSLFHSYFLFSSDCIISNDISSESLFFLLDQTCSWITLVNFKISHYIIIFSRTHNLSYFDYLLSLCLYSHFVYVSYS